MQRELPRAVLREGWVTVLVVGSVWERLGMQGTLRGGHALNRSSFRKGL